MKYTSPLKQHGISMVEILISLLLAFILIGTIIQIYMSNKQAFRISNANSEIQENLRFATELLGRHLRMTGYRDTASVSTAMATVFPGVNYAGQNFAAGEVIRGTDNDVVIRYQGNGTIRDCEDNTVIPAGTVVSTHFFLNGGNLSCDTSMDVSAAQPLINNVNQFTVRYGIDSDGDGTADRYDRTAGVVNWAQVVSVRLTVTQQATEANTKSDGGNLANTITTTVGLRNLLP